VKRTSAIAAVPRVVRSGSRDRIHTGLLSLLFALCTLLCSTVAPFSALAQQNTVKIIIDGDAKAGGVIGVFQAKGTLYASLTDLAATFRVATFENHQTAKMELKQGPYRIKVTGGSPFIVVTEQNGVQTVYQLPANVLYAAGSFFVPLQSFIPFFGLVFDKSGSFEVTSNTLRVSPGPPPSAFQIPTIDLEPKSNGMLIRIRSTKHVKDMESWLRQDGWLYVTLVDVKADVARINALKGNGIVKDIVAIQSPTSVQLTFKLVGTIAATEILREDDSEDILIAVRTPVSVEKPAEKPHTQQQAGKPPAATPHTQQQSDKTPAEPSHAQPPVVKPPANQPQQKPQQTADGRSAEIPDLPDMEERKHRWDLDVIVIDPGHGGKDPGTIGVTGVKEKDVVLSIGLKLGDLLRKHLPGVKVVYTRSTDVFIPLYRRGQIANEAGGKLFISIHCNATPRKPSNSRGTEVYLLRPNRSEEAIAIAEQENAVITLEEGYEDRYQELTDENFILVTMAQTAYMRSSEVLAEQVHREMSKVPGLHGRGVRQAGFYVLVGAAMPNILVETAFVSNREDEKLLKSRAGQSRIAESLYQGILRYKKEYEKLLTHE
jgi:N-acetylmuramoyl-L-alanine amidase